MADWQPIVCDRVEIKAEARSCSEQKLEVQTVHMRKCFEEAAEKFGGSVDFDAKLMYSAFHVKEDEDIIAVLKKASLEAGIELRLESTGGGSDTNIINGKGIRAVNMGIGASNIHSVDEKISIDEMVKTVKFLVAIIKSVEN